MKLNSLFCDNLVFAENKPIRVFGTGDEDVSVCFRGEIATVTPYEGKWIASFRATSSGGPFELEVVSGDDFVTVKNVYVGPVYLIAGQSNAKFQLCFSDVSLSEYKDDEFLRNYYVKPIEDDPLDPGPGWRTARKENVGKWSAIAYLAGRVFRRRTGKTVGTVSCCQGASVIESWLPKEDAEGFRLLDSELMSDHFCPAFSSWNGNGEIYSKMLSPLFPFSFNGVIWYQGESDTSFDEGMIYDSELCLFMDVVRKRVGDPELKFAVIQIADLDSRRDEGWRAIQLAQKRAVEKDGKSFLVVSSDVCGSESIHPVQKTALSESAAGVFLGAQ